jgi:acyl-coenzyme A thioesterase PaaI-like protein
MLHRPDFQEALRYVFEQRIPFVRALDLKFRIVEGRAEVSFAKQDFMLGNTKLKVLHGGVTAAVLDSIAGPPSCSSWPRSTPSPISRCSCASSGG